tara:strand:- start:11 stop:994 length:984 start_codon:yes stop_codon:yes gene_type:complete
MGKLYKIIFFFIVFSCEEMNPSLPDVTINYPETNSIISGLVTINCTFNNINSIANVELLIDGNSSGITEDSEPFSLVWNTSNYEDKEYSIIVRSFDINGSYKDSERVIINLYKTVELFGEYYSVENTTKLDLNNRMLIGHFPPKIFELVKLTLLDLSFNQFNGEIPLELASMSDLRILNLNANQFVGSIPPELGYMIKLNELKLSMNQISGAIPQSITNLENLTNINLSINQLSGLIPFDFDNLTNLNYLNLSNNKLTGSVPSELGNFQNLIELKLYRNSLSGALPETFCDLSETNCSISLYNNQICPPYPSCIQEIMGEQETSNCN